MPSCIRQFPQAYLAVIVVLALMCPSHAFSGVCQPGPLEIAFSGDLFEFVGLRIGSTDLATPPVFGSMGRPGLCEQFRMKYCTAYPRVRCIPQQSSGLQPTTRYAGNCAPVMNMPTYGFCANFSGSGCSKDVLQKQADAMFNHITKENNGTAFPFQKNYGIGGSCSKLQHSPACGPDSYAFAEIECLGEAPFTDDFSSSTTGSVAFTIVIIFVIVSVGSTLLIIVNKVYRSRTASRVAEEGLLGKGNLAYGSLQEDAPGAENVSTKTSGSEPPHLLHPIIRKVAGWWDLIGGFEKFMTAESRNVGAVDTRYFEGLRTIAMLSVIYGHTFLVPDVVIGFMNPLAPFYFIKDYASIGLFPAFLAVDTFFWLSGFLFMHLYMKAVEKKHVAEGGSVDDETIRPLGIRETLLMYLHRYLRLTPVVMFTMMFAVWLGPYLVRSSPNYRIYGEDTMFASCHDNWWHQLLYIGNMNYKDGWNNCMVWFWYLDVDMQLFLLSPIFASLFYIHRGAFLFLLVGGIVSGTAVQSAYQGYTHSDFYYKTYMRFVPYLYGIAAAAVVRKVNFKALLQSWKSRGIVYLIAAALMVSTINVMWWYEARIAKAVVENRGSLIAGYENDSYASFANAWPAFAWGLGLCVMASSWTAGHGGHVKRFLSHPTFGVLSKLTFTCYMLHPIVLMVHLSDSYTRPQFSRVSFYYDYGGVVIWSFFSAMWLYLVVENPLAMVNAFLTKRAASK